MEKWIFTFGGNHKLVGKCQPVYAESYSQARERMAEDHGANWAFQYSEKIWNGYKNDENRMWPMETELEPIYAEND